MNPNHTSRPFPRRLACRPGLLATSLAALLIAAPAVQAGEACELAGGGTGGGSAPGVDALVCGVNNEASGTRSTALGFGNEASGAGSTALGRENEASGHYTTAVGYLNAASGPHSTALGLFNLASGMRSTAVGHDNVATGQGATAIGTENQAGGDYSVAIGALASASGNESLAFGRSAVATGDGSVAIGPGSVASADNVVSIGAWGSGRRLTNLASGVNATDAVNMGQLSNLSGIVAMLSAETLDFFGGGAAQAGGVITPPTYVIGGNDYHDVGAAFGAVDAGISELHDLIAQSGGVPGPPGPEGPQGPEGPAGGGPRSLLYDDDSRDVLTLAGAEGTRVANVADAVDATDAVNRRQMQAGDEATLGAANAYTDRAVGEVMTGMDSLRSDMDWRLSRQDRRIDRQGAMSAAMLNMAINAAGSRSERGRVAAGVGLQGGRAAMSVGYGKRVGARGSFSLGAAFSGSERSVGAGFGLDL